MLLASSGVADHYILKTDPERKMVLVVIGNLSAWGRNVERYLTPRDMRFIVMHFVPVQTTVAGAARTCFPHGMNSRGASSPSILMGFILNDGVLQT